MVEFLNLMFIYLFIFLQLFNFFNKNTGQFEEADDLIREGLVIVSKRVNRELEIYPVIENWLDNAIEDYKKIAA